MSVSRASGIIRGIDYHAEEAAGVRIRIQSKTFDDITKPIQNNLPKKSDIDAKALRKREPRTRN